MTNPREIFFTKVQERIRNGQDIVILTADLAAPSLDNFRREFKGRYLSVGVAEQNLITTACGLAAAGKQVVAWGLNPFVTTRALDQIRNTISLMKYPVIFAGLHAGLSSAISGATHVVTMDLSLIRTCAGITTYNVSDIDMADRLFDEALTFAKPVYLRFDKDINYRMERMDEQYQDGISMIKEGRNYLIITTGYHTKKILDVINGLSKKGIDPAILDIYQFPFDRKKLTELVSAYDKVLTVEEHILQGGLGSAVLEALADHGVLRPVKRIGIDIEQGYPEFFGRRGYFQRYFGLDDESIEKVIMDYFMH